MASWRRFRASWRAPRPLRTPLTPLQVGTGELRIAPKSAAALNPLLLRSQCPRSVCGLNRETRPPCGVAQVCTPHAVALVDMRVLEVADAVFLAQGVAEPGRVAAIAACASPLGGARVSGAAAQCRPLSLQQVPHRGRMIFGLFHCVFPDLCGLNLACLDVHADGTVRCALGQAGIAELTVMDWGVRPDGGAEADEVEDAEEAAALLGRTPGAREMTERCGPGSAESSLHIHPSLLTHHMNSR